jgi:hypothetical protein
MRALSVCSVGLPTSRCSLWFVKFLYLADSRELTADSRRVVALRIELSAAALSGLLGQPALDYRLASALSSPYGNRTHLSALKGQYPSPIDERAVVSCVCAHAERKVGREALESSIPDLQSGALPSKLPAQILLPGRPLRSAGKPKKKARRLSDTGPCWLIKELDQVSCSPVFFACGRATLPFIHPLGKFPGARQCLQR